MKLKNIFGGSLIFFQEPGSGTIILIITKIRFVGIFEYFNEICEHFFADYSHTETRETKSITTTFKEHLFSLSSPTASAPANFCSFK